MGLPQTTPSHPYPPSLQLKLYQAFIFSVPILFTIILFLLFYLFYLKKRSSALSSPSQINATIFSGAPTIISLPYDVGLKKDLKEKLSTVIFDEDLKARDPQCCVCLADFEIQEPLHQIPLCKHIFHFDCIHHWLVSNATCPLCRALIHPARTMSSLQTDIPRLPNGESNNSLQDLGDGTVSRVSSDVANFSSQVRLYTTTAEGSSTGGPWSLADRSQGRVHTPSP